MNRFLQILTLTINTLFLYSCSTTTTKVDDSLFYSEANLAFTDLKYYRIKGNTWIRNPENILTVHETLKKIGYNKIVSDDDLANYQMWYYSPDKKYLNISLGVKIDSLVITFPDFKNATTFYKEFWQRRISEQNDQATFKVLSEVREILLNKKVLPVQENLVNDTLFQLASFDLATTITETTATNYFNYLKTIGLHLSAHNLLFESYRYQDLKLDRDGFDSTLTRTKEFYGKEPWITDDTK